MALNTFFCLVDHYTPTAVRYLITSPQTETGVSSTPPLELSDSEHKVTYEELVAAIDEHFRLEVFDRSYELRGPGNWCEPVLQGKTELL